MDCPQIGPKSAIKLGKNAKRTNGTYFTRPHITTYCDSDWATDIESRSIPLAQVTSVLQVPLAFNSRTQSTVATSNAEAELYAIGLGISDSLHIYKLMLQEHQHHLQQSAFDLYQTYRESHRTTTPQLSTPVRHTTNVGKTSSTQRNH